MRLQNVFKCSVFEASRLVSTKTLLLKHYYRRQGVTCKHTVLTKLSGKEKHININKCAALSRVWVGQKFVYVFFLVHSLWGRKNTETKSPSKNPGTIPSNFSYLFFFFMYFFRSPNWGFYEFNFSGRTAFFKENVP